MAATMCDSFTPSLVLDPTMTTILVGPDQRRFAVHKNLLCHYSNYFSAAYNSQMKEAQEHLFEFKDVAGNLFSIMFTWLYSGKIFLVPQHDDRWEYETIDGDCYEGDGDEDSEPGDFGAYAAEVDHEQDGQPQDEMTYDDELEVQGEVEKLLWNPYTGEQKFFLDVHPATTQTTQASELDVCQLQALIIIAERSGSGLEYVPGWKELLAQKEAEQEEAEQEEQDTRHDPSTDPVFGILTHLYILADRLDIPALLHDTMDQLRDQLKKSDSGIPSFHAVKIAFEQLPPTSLLRLWLIHVFAYNWDPDQDSPQEIALRADLPKEFMLEVMMLNARRLPRRLEWETSPLDLNWCAYHDHAKTYREVEECLYERNANFDDDEWEWYDC